MPILYERHETRSTYRARSGWRRLAQIAILASVSLPLLACETQADRQRQAAAVAAELQSQQRAQEAAERARVAQNPDEYLQTSDMKVFDRGIINSYRELTGVTVLNKSKYPLDNLRGEVDWLSEDGAKYGSVPFTLKGSIPAGDTKVFSNSAQTLASGTVMGNARRARLRFTHAEIVGNP